MDKETRNRLQRATQAARRLLEDEMSEQLGGIYDIQKDGSIATSPGAHLREDPEALRVRGKLVTAVGHHREQGLSKSDSVAALLRECAFTTLNRFVALKMLEARKIVLQCVSKGAQSSGFREFIGLASGLAALPDKGYRLYIDSLFDEIGREVRVLFDRRDPASLLWPRKAALDALLDILNAPGLAEVWGEDETIGWVYQYFNGEDERKQMRSESQAPRNSRELAVRNQFFTPRYVVEFLTDNTLARTWVEMRQGNTRLVKDCRYLVKRKTEVFLAEGKDAPEVDEKTPLDERTVYVPFRGKKDPRDLKVLDPACGSGHFLLYSFDILLTIYEEAWSDQDSPSSKVTGRRLAEDYASLQGLHRALPGLILRHNLHGVDIDPRAAQIAALALWMRAQRAWDELGFLRADRPLVTRANIVVAEPMPGEVDLLDELCADLDRGVADIVRAVFENMKLAGEVGTLLRIENTVRRELKKLAGRGPMFAEQDAARWAEVEEAVYGALWRYAEGVGDSAYRKRLFAGDAAQGFALLDVCRTAYDVLLMNPPFGEPTIRTDDTVSAQHPLAKGNLYIAFALRALELGAPRSYLGMLSDATFVHQTRYQKYRELLVGDKDLSLRLLTANGWGVLDAYVETACIIAEIRPVNRFPIAAMVDLRDSDDSAKRLITSIQRAHEGLSNLVWVDLKTFSRIPKTVLAFWLPTQILSQYLLRPSLDPTLVDARCGMSSSDNFRFYKVWWEVPTHQIGKQKKWRYLSNGGPPIPFLRQQVYVVDYADDARAAKARVAARFGSWSRTIINSSYYGRPGLTYGKRTESFSVQVLPSEQVISNEGQGIFLDFKTADWRIVAGYLNSSMVSYLLNSIAGQHKEAGYVGSIPAPPPQFRDSSRVVNRVQSALDTVHWMLGHIPESQFFRWPLGMSPADGDSIGAVMVRLAEATRVFSSALVENDVDLENAVGFATANLPWNHRDWRLTEILFEASNETLRVAVASDIIGYSIGVSVGRFNVRLLSNRAATLPKREMFEPLPPCSPGMLTDSDGLPVTTPPPNYPIAFPTDGILTDDPGTDRDILTRIRQVFGIAFGENGENRFNEVRDILVPKTPDLRLWLRNKFFAKHIKRYSKSRRKAPIYWQLGTSSASYSVWLYIHRTGPDTLHIILRDHVGPKLRFENNCLATLRSEAGDSPAPSQRKDIEAQEAFVDELRSFRDELKRIAPLWNPNLDDGVIINASLLHRLFAHTRSWQTECEKHWNKLKTGDYDWAHLAMRLWPERVVPKCAEDCSLAIAHGLEPTFWAKDKKGKWQPRIVDNATVERLIQKRTSSAVKDALKQIAAAPPPSKAKRAARRPVTQRKTRKATPPPQSLQLPLNVPTRTSGPSAATLDALRAALHQHPNGAGKSDLIAASCIPETDWKAAIDALVGSNEVVRTGKARGTKYQLASSGGTK